MHVYVHVYVYVCMYVCTVSIQIKAQVFISYKQFLSQHLYEPFLHFT